MRIVELVNKKPRAVILDGQRILVTKWNDILFHIIEFIYDRHRDELLLKANNNFYRGKKGWIYLTTKKELINGTAHEIKPGLFIEKKYNATYVVERSKMFLQDFGYNDFKVETTTNEIFTILPGSRTEMKSRLDYPIGLPRKTIQIKSHQSTSSIEEKQEFLSFLNMHHLTKEVAQTTAINFFQMWVDDFLNHSYSKEELLELIKEANEAQLDAIAIIAQNRINKIERINKSQIIFGFMHGKRN